MYNASMDTTDKLSGNCSQSVQQEQKQKNKNKNKIGKLTHTTMACKREAYTKHNGNSSLRRETCDG